MATLRGPRPLGRKNVRDLADAMRRTLPVAGETGIRLLLVHTVDEKARAFYLHYGFEPSPSYPTNLRFLIKDIRATIEGG